jgi:hypothetical protein
MKKCLVRIVATLLISCLAADPARGCLVDQPGLRRAPDVRSAHPVFLCQTLSVRMLNVGDGCPAQTAEEYRQATIRKRLESMSADAFEANFADLLHPVYMAFLRAYPKVRLSALWAFGVPWQKIQLSSFGGGVRVDGARRRGDMPPGLRDQMRQAAAAPRAKSKDAERTLSRLRQFECLRFWNRPKEFWTYYWEHADSARYGDSVIDAAHKSHWQTFAQQVLDGSVSRPAFFVDFGTGQGEVALILSDYAAQRGDSVQINAYDSAEFEHLQQRDNILFQKRDMANTGLPEGSVAGATSQYAFEYSDISQFLVELHRILASNGRFRAIAHCRNSVIVENEMIFLTLLDELHKARLFSKAKAAVNQNVFPNIAYQEAEKPFIQWLDRLPRDNPITQFMFDGIEGIHSAFEARKKGSTKEALDSLRKVESLCAHRAHKAADLMRLAQAFEDDNLPAWHDYFKAHGFESDIKPFMAGGHLMGWDIDLRKIAAHKAVTGELLEVTGSESEPHNAEPAKDATEHSVTPPRKPSTMLSLAVAPLAAALPLLNPLVSTAFLKSLLTIIPLTFPHSLADTPSRFRHRPLYVVFRWFLLISLGIWTGHDLKMAGIQGGTAFLMILASWGIYALGDLLWLRRIPPRSAWGRIMLLGLLAMLLTVFWAPYLVSWSAILNLLHRWLSEDRAVGIAWTASLFLPRFQPTFWHQRTRCAA